MCRDESVTLFKTGSLVIGNGRCHLERLFVCLCKYYEPTFTASPELFYAPFTIAVFTRCGAHEQALSSFQKKGNWRQVFCMASLLRRTDEQVISLARSVAGMNE